ncbi:guanylate kinase-associated protein mars-like isoform X2 [Photinus pyralis]|uniref:guanylate kinase-associated protein mars-like isoform X2 n=2 Tax=Photinus pyralis TaxID=7054 RepID=UPI00126732C1|nr:guanylate kinase-associated protein mars-like isoform X2 [Photinus pyralis]
MANGYERSNLYKVRVRTSTTLEKMEEVADNLRRTSRWTTLLQRRNITAFMSPINSPHTSIKKIERSVIKKDKSDERREQLNKWKEQKKKRLAAEKAKAKPIFKVCRVKDVVVPDISEIYKKIKGNDQFKVAPSSTYKFKAPVNVKPLNMKSPTKSKARRKIDFVLNDTSSKQTRVSNNRSYKNSSMTKNTSSDIKVIKKTTTTIKETYRKCESNEDGARCVTPVENDPPVTYISPFITVSRGKENSRREYHNRPSGVQKNMTPKAGARYFENLLQKQEQRLSQLCCSWETYSDTQNPPEEACDMIRMAIGQTKLLMRKKFTKFQELIGQCKNSNGDKIVTCLDLHGFWDIILIQINNLDSRFENLDRLKTNNWEEILPVAPTSTKQVKLKKVSNTKRKGVKSSLRDLIKEQRKKNMKEIKNSPMIVVTTPRSKLANISNILHESAAVTPRNQRAINTPKSILKPERTPKQRSIRKVKSVLFSESTEKENLCETSNLIQFSPNKSVEHPRRSSRLAEKNRKS